MGKKNKSVNNRQPNAPDLQEVLLDQTTNRQPPHNPYYPSISNDYQQQLQYVPPPPYSDLTAPKGVPPYMNNNSLPMTQIYQSGPSSRMPTSSSNNQPTTVIVQQPTTISRDDRKRENCNKSVRKFNNEMAAAALCIIILSVLANVMFSQRPCIDSFVVHKPTKDISIKIIDVHQAQTYVAYASCLILFICLVKCVSTSPKSNKNSHCCYLFVMILLLFHLTVTTGYLAYLAFYSPCTTDLGQLAQSGVKSLFNSLIDEYPKSVAKEIGEANVFNWGAKDPIGIWIFVIDVFNFIIYFSAFISALSLC